MAISQNLMSADIYRSFRAGSIHEARQPIIDGMKAAANEHGER